VTTSGPTQGDISWPGRCVFSWPRRPGDAVATEEEMRVRLCVCVSVCVLLAPEEEMCVFSWPRTRLGRGPGCPLTRDEVWPQ